MKNKFIKALEETLIIIGILYLFVILVSFFTSTSAIFYNSRMFVLFYFVASLVVKILRVKKTN